MIALTLPESDTSPQGVLSSRMPVCKSSFALANWTKSLTTLNLPPTRSRRDIGDGWVHAWIPTVVQSTISFGAQLGQPIPAGAANLSKQTANVNVGATDGESIDRPIGRGIPSGVRGAITGQIQFRKI